MKRLFAIIGSAVIVLVMLAPVALAADEQAHSDRILVAIGGDLTLPAGERADTVVVVGGTATILGEADTVVIVDGRAVVRDTSVGTLVAVSSPVELGAGSSVRGDVLGLDSAIDRAAGATVGGEVRDLGLQLFGIGFVLGPALLLLVIGVALVTIVAGLFLAAIAARQVRAAETLITREPFLVLVVGLAGLVLPILLVIGLMITVVGVPLAVAILVFVWPFVAYLGYVVAGIWIGDWILTRVQPTVVRERPYAAAVIGVFLLQLLQIVPPIAAIASLFGYGAVILLAWRTFRGQQVGTPAAGRVTPAPMPS